LTPGFNLWKSNQGSFAFRVLDLTVFRFFVIKRKNYALKKPKNSLGRKVKKIKTKKTDILQKRPG